jgi:hypothetical protein
MMKSTGRKTVKGTKVSAPLSAKAKSTTATAATVTATVTAASRPTHEQISKRAFELYLERGSVEGHHEEDWLIAEAELSSSK